MRARQGTETNQRTLETIESLWTSPGFLRTIIGEEGVGETSPQPVYLPRPFLSRLLVSDTPFCFLDPFQFFLDVYLTTTLLSLTPFFK